MHTGPRNAIQDAIVCPTIDAPALRFPDVGQARAELIAEEPKQAQDHITDPSGIGHDRHGPQSLPLWALQQLDAWSTPAFTASDKHVASSQTVLQAFHHPQGIRAPVGHGLATWEDKPAPGTGDQV
jgi:hypothetical protein